MAVPTLRPEAAATLARGAVIPAHPLALTADRRIDERRQRALTRYYLDAGAGGIARGSAHHTVRDPRSGARPVRARARARAEELDARASADVVRIAGVAGGTAQAVAEAELARDLGYDAVLVALVWPAPTSAPCWSAQGGGRGAAGGRLLPADRDRGPVLDRDFWREFASIPAVVAVKAAPFDRYRTLELVRGRRGLGPRRRDRALHRERRCDRGRPALRVPRGFALGCAHAALRRRAARPVGGRHTRRRRSPRTRAAGDGRRCAGLPRTGSRRLRHGRRQPGRVRSRPTTSTA